LKLPRDVAGAELARALAKVGTLAAILDEVARHAKIGREQLLELLFG
jgi:hypothetical protein